MARTGMSNLITRLRGMCNAGTVDYTLGATTYWTDDHVQDVLDAYRMDVKHEMLLPKGEQTAGGTVVYQDYYFRCADAEEASGGTAVWTVSDSTGTAIGTANYTVNYRAGHIRFTANTLGTAYFLSYRTFDMQRAAAELWEQKAAHVSARFDVETDNHKLKPSQLRQSYFENAALYRSQARARSVVMDRDD